MLCNKRSHSNEKHVLQLESSPHALQLEKSLCGNEDPAQPKINKSVAHFFKKKKRKMKVVGGWDIIVKTEIVEKVV